jgi:penicillin-insensitive murein endopeptidase
MVPVRDNQGRPVEPPTNLFNQFGYALEFDAKGRTKELAIDFETMAQHLLALKKAAAAHGLKIRIVIFDPQLRSILMQGATGQKLKASIPFSRNPSWVRHDEHYHVDFEPLR